MAQSSSNLWFNVPSQRPDATARVVIFPYAGGGASAFRHWATSAPEHIEFAIAQYPGREMRFAEPLALHVDELVPSLAASATPFLDKPAYFYGHSLGALIGFEVLRELRRTGHPLPRAFYMSGRRAPHLSLDETQSHTLSTYDLIEELKTLNGTPPGVLENKELLSLMLPIYRADITVHETYRYFDDVPFQIPFRAFGGTEDPVVSEDSMSAWSEHTDQDFHCQWFDGDHFFINKWHNVLLSTMVGQLEAELR